MREILAVKEHRPFAFPKSPWVMSQSWDELLFAHWAFEPDLVKKLIPAQMQLDTFDGAAWVAVVPFRMRKVRPRFGEYLPLVADFLELNVRTYVVVDGIRGVYFFSLDASSFFAVEGARLWFHLPYYYARMTAHERDGWFHYRSERVDKRGLAAELDVRYRPAGAVYRSKPGTLEHFLTERYCLYTISGDNSLLRAQIHHVPWSLQKAQADLVSNTMLEPLGLPVSGEPLLHFSHSIQTVEWTPEVVPIEN